MSQILPSATADLLSGPHEPAAMYFLDSDCVEYAKEDAFCVYDRVDSFLTLVLDRTGERLIGFKLKGFKNIFEKFIRPRLQRDIQFLELVSAIETVFTEAGDQLFSERNGRVEQAYKAAMELAANDNVRLAGTFLTAA